MIRANQRVFFSLSLFAVFLLCPPAAQRASALTDDEKNTISIYQKASPSVVNVISTVITRDFFLNAIPREGSGSGAIIDTQGHILTNNHVIRDAQKLEVTLADGSKWPAKLVGTDPDNDLAVIRISRSRGKAEAAPPGGLAPTAGRPESPCHRQPLRPRAHGHHGDYQLPRAGTFAPK